MKWKIFLTVRAALANTLVGMTSFVDIHAFTGALYGATCGNRQNGGAPRSGCLVAKL
jgi:hypothetical protein